MSSRDFSPAMIGFRKAEYWMDIDSASQPLSCSASISHFRQVSHRRSEIHFPEQAVVARVGNQTRHLTVWIIGISENDGIRRTRLLTSRLNLPVFNPPTKPHRLGTCFFDPLNAHRALFHDAAGPDRNIRIESEILCQIVPGIVEPVESTNFIRTVVGAVPGTDA